MPGTIYTELLQHQRRLAELEKTGDHSAELNFVRAQVARLEQQVAEQGKNKPHPTAEMQRRAALQVALAPSNGTRSPRKG